MEASYLSSHENVEWRIYCASCNCRYFIRAGHRTVSFSFTWCSTSRDISHILNLAVGDNLFYEPLMRMCEHTCCRVVPQVNSGSLDLKYTRSWTAHGKLYLLNVTVNHRPVLVGHGGEASSQPYSIAD